MTADLRRALAGTLAIEARLSERAARYGRRRSTPARTAPSIDIQDGASPDATVIEVRAPDRIGLLRRITKALAEMDLDIRHATVATVGNDVVDTFYVRTQGGQRLADPGHRGEVERAVLHAVGSLE